MWVVESNFITQYVDAVSASFNAFMPLWAATVGVFLTFAIANMTRFFITRAVK